MCEIHSSSLCMLRPGLSAKYMVKPKLEKAKRKCSDVAQSVKGKASVLVKKPSEGTICIKKELYKTT